MQLNSTAMSGPEFLDALATAEAANGNDINADIYRQRSVQWHNDQRELQRVQQRCQDLEDKLADIRRTVRAA